MEYINEKELERYPTMISFDCTERILEQMKNTVCRIKLMDGSLGSGFFCKIPFASKDKFLPVLVTNNHLINKLVLENKNEPIMIYTKNSQKYKTFYLDNRIYYTNKKYDVTFIEIKENSDDIHNFLELDDNTIENIFDDKNDANDNPHFYYVKETIYIMQYPEGKLSVSYGILDKVSESNNFDFNHLCSTKGGSSGSPILNIKNNKVFGIHKQASSIINCNKGSFLDIAIKEFFKQNLYKIKNSSQPIVENKNENENKNINDNKDKIENKNKSENKEVKTMSIKEFGEKFNIYVDNRTFQLHLMGRKFENEILEILCNMPFNELKDLRLGNNLINNINILEKFQFQKLEQLWLDNNKIQDITVFEKVKFTNLKILWLDHNNISDIKVFIKANFEKLEKLNLSNNQISDITILEKVKWPEIKNLSFFQNNISDIKFFERVKFYNLISLDLRSNNIDKKIFSSTINELKNKIKFFNI
jgi:Leucine-rich repeat (LRR) protein